MTERKFYRTVFEIVVLSEFEVTRCPPLRQVANAIEDGDWSGKTSMQVSVPVDGATMATMLKEQGSDPEFFQIDEHGNDLGEDGPVGPVNYCVDPRHENPCPVYSGCPACAEECESKYQFRGTLAEATAKLIENGGGH